MELYNMEKENKEEVNDFEREIIAEQIENGNTSGLFNNDDGYRISWKIEINKFEN